MSPQSPSVLSPSRNHGRAVAPSHRPALHVPSVWQSLASPQALPSLLPAVNTQPFLASQLSVVQGSASSHTRTVPPWQTPDAHLVPMVQRLPSVQALLLKLYSQPLNLWHESLVHELPSLQLMPLPTHDLVPVQTSPVVHLLLSLHGLPVLIGR